MYTEVLNHIGKATFTSSLLNFPLEQLSSQEIKTLLTWILVLEEEMCEWQNNFFNADYLVLRELTKTGQIGWECFQREWIIGNQSM